MAFIGPGIASAGGYFPRENSLEKYRRCGRRTLLLLWCLSPLLKRSCWYVTDKSRRAIDITVRNLQR